MRKEYTLILLLTLLLGCKKEDEIINNDLSVISKAERFVYTNYLDLNNKLSEALVYNYGVATSDEIETSVKLNSDTTRVVITISYNNNASSKYKDQNLSNNTAVIDLEKSTVVHFEGVNSSIDYTVRSPWDICNITFSFFNHTSDFSATEQESVFLEAGKLWTDHIPGMTFINIGPNNNNALIRVSFTNSLNHPPCPAPFSICTIAHAHYPSPNPLGGDIHFNDNMHFTNTSDFSAIFDFKSIAVHEIGHALGIGHNDDTQDPNAIMYESIRKGQIKRDLIQDDINAIEDLYLIKCSGNAHSNISITGDLNFGTVNVNSTSPQKSFTVHNTGNSSFAITNISVPNGFNLINGSSTVVQANSSKTYYITFSPTQIQSYSGTITVTNTATNANSSNSSIQVFGEGGSAGSSTILLSGNLNFGNVIVGQSMTKSFTISNIGTQSFNVSSINFPDNVFYSNNWTSGTINPGGTQNVTVVFQPANQQVYNGNVTVNNNANNGNNTITISGTGTQSSQNVVLAYNNSLIKDGNGGGIGNSNGIIESGEEIDLDVQLINTGNSLATNVSAVLSTNAPNITITDDDVNWPNILGGSTQWDGDFDFDVSANCPTKIVTFNLQISCDQGSWNQTFTVNVQNNGGGNNPIPITPSDICSNAPAMNVNTSYSVNVNTANYSLSSPISGVSSGGGIVRGFWLKVSIPNNFSGFHKVLITNASNNFDAVIGMKAVCGSTYLGNTFNNPATNYANNNGFGGNETFETVMHGTGGSGSGNYYYIRIYHINGTQSPNITFDIEVQ